MVDLSLHPSHHDDYFVSLLDQPRPVGLNDVVRYDHSKQQWHIWDGFRWAPDKKEEVYELVRRCYNGWITELANDPETAKIMASILNKSKKDSVLGSLESREGIAMIGTEWDPDPYLIAFTNGVLDLRTLGFDSTPDPAALISRSTGYDWDPDADMEPFVNFLRQIMGDDAEMAEYLMRILGYAMIGFQREQKFWMWVGPGQNGKGVLAKVVTAALGDYADTPSSELYMKTRFGAARSDAARPDLLRLQGTRFTWMSEPHGGSFNDELLKAHTGDDPIQARDLYGKAASFTTFRPTHTINFLTNDPPRTEDTGPSMRRRVRIVRFEQDFSGERDDKGLEDRLKQPENLQGVIRLLAIGANEYFQFGLPEPAKVTAWSAAYIEENDPLAHFIDEACVVGTGHQGQAALLWAAYQDWCATRDVEPGSQMAFGTALGRRFRKEKKRTSTVYVGIKPKGAMEAASED